MVKASLLKKYKMYQAAVQDPHQQILTFKKAFSDNFDFEPLVLKEDFSGTFWISSEWVKLGAENIASAIDLSQEVLDVGRILHYNKLTSSQKQRLHTYQQDVSITGQIKADIVAGCNFSFFIIRDRQQLLKYFKGAKSSLKKNGIFILESVGGPGFEDTPLKERRLVKKKGKNWFRYIWHQKSFDPIHRRGDYAIHFDLLNGKKMKDVFTYDWRVWTLPEVMDLMYESGFKDVQIYWEEEEPDNQGYTVFSRKNSAGNDNNTWIAYIVGVKV